MIDLGDRSFTVLHLPGHSFGCIGLYDERDGLLFSGDAVYDDTLIDDMWCSDRDDYRATMRRLLDLPVRIVHGGHGESFGEARLKEIAREYLDRRPIEALGQGQIQPLQTPRPGDLSSPLREELSHDLRNLASLRRRFLHPPGHSGADDPARRVLCARAGLAHRAADGGRRRARRLHRHDAVDARHRRAAGGVRHRVHRAEMDRRRLSDLSRHKAVPRRRRPQRRAADRRGVLGAR